MSSNNMLKQAIIDATTLREVALKNAEAIVVEKYSDQIKEAVDTMLDQEEEELLPEDPMADLGADESLPVSRVGSTEEEPGSELVSQTTLAATDGERLCPCPDEGATIEIDFGGLQDMMKKLEDDEEMPSLAGEEEAMPGLTPEDALPEDEELPLQESAEEEDEEIMLELSDLLGEDFFSDSGEEEGAEAEEEGAEALSAIAEKTQVADFSDEPIEIVGKPLPKKKSKKKSADPVLPKKKDREVPQVAAPKDPPRKYMKNRDKSKDLTPAQQQYARQMGKIKESASQDDKILKENLVLSKANSKALQENKQLTKENKEIKSLLVKLSGKLEEVNLSNAKLIYTNQVLNGASLNERQKQRIVESIKSADSVEAAKSIFETLQSAVGSSLGSRNDSQSLSEAISRGSATTLRQKKNKQSKILIYSV